MTALAENPCCPSSRKAKLRPVPYHNSVNEDANWHILSTGFHRANEKHIRRTFDQSRYRGRRASRENCRDARVVRGECARRGRHRRVDDACIGIERGGGRAVGKRGGVETFGLRGYSQGVRVVLEKLVRHARVEKGKASHNWAAVLFLKHDSCSETSRSWIGGVVGEKVCQVAISRCRACLELATRPRDIVFNLLDLARGAARVASLALASKRPDHHRRFVRQLESASTEGRFLTLPASCLKHCSSF